MSQATSGIVLVVNLVLALIVGIRLLRSDGPERGLGVYFLASAFLASVLQAVVYGGLVDPRVRLDPLIGEILLGTAILGMAVGGGVVVSFTARTFYPDAAWTRPLIAAGWLLALGGWGYECLAEGFPIRFVPGPGHWTAWLGRTAPVVWIAVESLRYWVRMRKRVRLGLADPLLANRFLLWGSWSLATLVNLTADPVARVLYVQLARGEETAEQIVQQIVVGTMSVTMVLGAISAVLLFLTFFPTDAYRAWLERRFAVQPAGS